MNYSMYVDDVRNLKNDFDIVIKTSNKAIKYMTKYGIYL